MVGDLKVPTVSSSGRIARDGHAPQDWLSDKHPAERADKYICRVSIDVGVFDVTTSSNSRHRKGGPLILLKFNPWCVAEVGLAPKFWWSYDFALRDGNANGPCSHGRIIPTREGGTVRKSQAREMIRPGFPWLSGAPDIFQLPIPILIAGEIIVNSGFRHVTMGIYISRWDPFSADSDGSLSSTPPPTLHDQKSRAR